MSKQQSLITVFVGLILVFIAACTPADTTQKTVYTTVTEGSLKAGDAIPVPTGDVLVTVTGDIGTSNVDDSIQMDRDTIESVGLVKYTVDDPFENTSITYEGVLMSDLLALWQVGKDATTLHMVALNDYSVDVPMGDLQTYPVIFALKADDEYMPIATHGPAMLVYPYNDFEFDTAIYNDYWIWQIKEIEVR